MRRASRGSISKVHHTWNHTDEDRVLFLFDVWHPELHDDEIAAIREMFAGAARSRPAADK